MKVILVSKQILKNLAKTKENIIILWITAILSSFMYFFVQCSIDGNINSDVAKKNSEFFTALNSNSILSITFLICFICILCFLFYMFYKRFYLSESRYIGCYETLGFTRNTILILYSLFFFVIIMTSHLIGLGLGFFSSEILISTYKSVYSIENSIRGLQIKSLLLGVLLPVTILMLIECRVCLIYLKKPVYILLNKDKETKGNNLIIANCISGFFKGQKAVGIRIALRKPISIVLLILSVFLFDLLFIFSISLNLSSKTVFNSQLRGRSFQYKYELSYPEKEMKGQTCDYFLEHGGSIIWKNKEFIQNIIGLDNENKFFKLMKNEKIIIDISDDEIVINPRIYSVYGINIGDYVILNIGGKKIKMKVMSIADNSDLNSVYISKKALTDMLDIEEEYYNGIWSQTGLNNVSGKEVSWDEYISLLESNNVSNKISAVICQLLAIVVGCLLLFMAVLLNFEGNLENMLKLRILGYEAKEINSILVSVYRPVLLLGFILTLYPCLYTGKIISNSLSLQTGDYMPFQTGIFVIMFVFILINVVYSIIKFFFSFKVKRVISDGQLDRLMREE